MEIETIVTATEEEQTGDKFNGSVESSFSSNTTRHYNPTRDSSWLELDVCREYSRGDCSRTADECKYAHPTGSVVVKDGKVTCCFDFLKVSRERVKTVS